MYEWKKKRGYRPSSRLFRMGLARKERREIQKKCTRFPELGKKKIKEKEKIREMPFDSKKQNKKKEKGRGRR